MKDIILRELKKIEAQENVKIIMAIESGSRAWGFASPDSDYDVLDINGWDIKKALQLLHNSNPTVFEWCASPIVYWETEEFEWLKDILPQYFSVKKSLHHYWHTSETHYKTHLLSDEVNIKKYFYALRPLLAAKWILDKRCAPPMLFEELVEEELEAELVPEVNRLLDMKKTLPEMGKAPRIQVINDYIESELQYAAVCGLGWFWTNSPMKNVLT